MVFANAVIANRVDADERGFGCILTTTIKPAYSEDGCVTDAIAGSECSAIRLMEFNEQWITFGAPPVTRRLTPPMSDRLDEHFRRLRAHGRPPGYSLADKPIYDWLHGSQNQPPLSWLVLSITDIVEAMPAEVRDAVTPLRLTKYIVPTFMRRIGFARYPQVVRLLNGKRLRLWVRPTVDTSHGYNVADAYEKVRDMERSSQKHDMEHEPALDIQPERDVWDTDD